MAAPSNPSPSASGTSSSLRRTAQVIIVSSVMFTFISYWRTAAVVLCDMSSTAYYIGGGVYRVVKTAMGGFCGKLAVSALMFDYILTGPISGVSAGQYIMNLLLELLAYLEVRPETEAAGKFITNWGSVVIACGTTIYFF